MSEVTKLYENAEPDRNCNLYKHFTKCPMKHTQCEDCENFVYPPFTSEKQIELIKWLMRKKQTIQVELRLYENDYCISHITECEHNDAVEYVETGRKNTFDKALADLVNEMWQDLTEEERKQVKGILE